jgi:hypothetical protein
MLKTGPGGVVMRCSKGTTGLALVTMGGLYLFEAQEQEWIRDLIHGSWPLRILLVRSTCALTHERLGHDALIFRYQGTDDGLPPGEGAFGIASFWAVECQARGGSPEAATAAFERLLAHANDVGLYAEEIDVATGAALGNFPQAFTHVGLINAALTLAESHDGPPRSDGDARIPTARGEESR